MSTSEFLAAFYDCFCSHFAARQICYHPTPVCGVDFGNGSAQTVIARFHINKKGQVKMAAKKETKKETKFMQDAKGDLVPVSYVSAFDKLRDHHVNKIVNRCRKLRSDLEVFMVEAIKLLDHVAAQKESHGEKGNISVSSFNGLFRVSIRQRYNIFFDARVREARDKMFAYVDSVLSRVKAEDAQALRVVLTESFRVGANNMLSVSKVLSLIRMDIKHPDWKAAQEVLKAALQPQKGKQYLLVETRPDRNHDFKSIRLDIADCWPIENAAAVPEVM